MPLYIVGAGIAAGLSIGVSTYFNAAASLEEARRDQLVTALEARKTALQSYFASIEQDLNIIASSVTTRWAFMGFAEGWSELEEEDEVPEEALQNLYMETNPYAANERVKLDAADDDSTYSEVHGLYHPWFREFLDERGHADVFLIDEAGNLLYSAFKAPDFATNLLSGQWRETDLAKAFQAVRDNPLNGYKTFFDFKEYAPRQQAPASFMATPVNDEDGVFLGVLALKISPDRINQILQQAAGLGETGETYLVGSDLLMRSDSRFADESTILARRVEMESVQRSLAGDRGTTLDVDANGQSVMATYAPLDFGGTRWALLGQMTEDEIMQPVAELGIQTVIISALVTALLFVLGWLLTNDIVAPLRMILQQVGEFANGNLAEVPAKVRVDEIGELARSMNHVYQKGLEAQRLRSALDNCSTMVMVVNRNFHIVYLNNALNRLLDSYEAEIRKELPNFKKDALIGADVGQFHPDLGSLTSIKGSSKVAEKRKICLGGRRLYIVASPVFSDSGKFLGLVIEWTDSTLELAAQEAIDSVIDAARHGDFSQRVNLDGADGIYEKLGDGMNQLTAVMAEVTDGLGGMFKAMASGDLCQRIDTDFQGKLGDLKDNANRTAEQLAAIVGQIQNATAEVESAAAEITGGTEDLAHRTEQSAASLEITASSTEQMATTVKQNAENAKNASELATSANESAKIGGEVVEQAVDAMARIDQSARRITDIIGVIDEMAFQSNLLALNASVEAARAGEAGKGFAVVAQEVRQLAQRSSEAAADIKLQIKESNGQVEDGVDLVNRAGESLKEIVGSIGKVAGIVEGISAASQDQAAGVQGINNSIASMDEMTQQNSALVEESTAAARTLNNQAEKLAELMGFFKLGGAAGQGPVMATGQSSEKPAVKRDAPAPALANDGWNEF